MSLTVVTGWSPAGYEEYGRRFAETFDRYWPKEVQLVVYGEQPVPLPRGEFRKLSEIPGCVEFLQRFDNAWARGQEPTPETANRWKPKHYASRYNFRFDAWKFCRQGFIPFDAFRRMPVPDTDEEEFLCWLDGDVVTHAPIPRGFIENILRPHQDLAFLGRGEKHSEIGFQLYRVTGLDGGEAPVVRVLEAFSDIYSTGEVFTLKEWHSAFVFDTARKRLMPPQQWCDMTPGGHGHVWHQSVLRHYTDHLKGKRKEKGRSDERRS